MLSHLSCIVRRQLRVRLRSAGEGGQALLFVLAGLALLGTIPIAIATTTVNQLPDTTRNLNFEAAYEAAQAGLNDYMQHLDSNEAYGLYSSTNQSSPANAAFTGWVQASKSPLEYYSYTPSDTSGEISLEVSGKAGSGATAVVRTLDYNIDPATSLDDVYWSNYETRDPVLGALLPSPPSGYQYCATRIGEASSDSYGQSPNNLAVNAGYPSTGPPGSGACEVSFQSGDTLNGPVFSNDTFRICNSPVFTSSVESGNIYNTSSGNAGIYQAANGCTASPTFSGGSPTKVSNQTPRTASDDLNPARSYGCFITGGTAPNSLSTVAVTLTLSIVSGHTQVAWSGPAGTIVDNAASNHNSCGTNGGTAINVATLSTGLIFVNGTATIAANSTMTGALDIVTCGSTTDGSAANSPLSCASSNASTSPSNIIIKGNLTYPSADKTLVSGQPTSDSTDVLGLIAANFVEVSATSSIEIDAAILALADSFYVNNWYGGSSYGTLSVFGSIAQNFRGPVGQSGGVGYTKNYNYDTSLQTLFPPFFIPPDGATWTPSSYEECLPGLSHSVQNSPSC